MFQHVSTKVMQDFFQVHLVQTFLRSLPGCCHTAHSWPQRVKQLGSNATNNIQKHYKNHRNLQFLMQFPIHHICGHWNFWSLRYSTDKVLASIGWNFCHLAIFSDRDLANTLWNSFANWFDLLLVYLTRGIILSILSSDSSNQSVPEQLAVERWRCWNPPEAKAARLGCVSGPNLLASQGLKMENPDGYTRYTRHISGRPNQRRGHGAVQAPSPFAP